MSVMEYVSTPLPIGRSCLPLEDFSEERRAAIIEAALAPRPPVAYTELGHDGFHALARIPSRAWYEWHWNRGIDPHRIRRKIPEWVRARVIERDGYVCQLCGEPTEPADVHLDHILPVSLGGQNDVDNLQVTHGACNLSKGARV